MDGGVVAEGDVGEGGIIDAFAQREGAVGAAAFLYGTKKDSTFEGAVFHAFSAEGGRHEHFAPVVGTIALTLQLLYLGRSEFAIG